jgi:hypothetical protein
MTIFDSGLVMKDREGTPGVFETIEKLDEMLNAYNIEHSFTLPQHAIIEKYPTAMAVLNYMDADEMVVDLIYALFCKVHRNAGDKEVAKALANVANHFIGTENCLKKNYRVGRLIPVIGATA